MSKVALIQQPPVILDRAATLARAAGLAGEAKSNGADLVVFTEAFIPGYPAWIWRLCPGSDWVPTRQYTSGY